LKGYALRKRNIKQVSKLYIIGFGGVQGYLGHALCDIKKERAVYLDCTASIARG
jgi:hypothetical protein